jgi:hypothetical protein
VPRVDEIELVSDVKPADIAETPPVFFVHSESTEMDKLVLADMLEIGVAGIKTGAGEA